MLLELPSKITIYMNLLQSSPSTFQKQAEQDSYKKKLTHQPNNPKKKKTTIDKKNQTTKNKHQQKKTPTKKNLNQHTSIIDIHRCPK